MMVMCLYPHSANLRFLAIATGRFEYISRLSIKTHYWLNFYLGTVPGFVKWYRPVMKLIQQIIGTFNQWYAKSIYISVRVP